MQYLHFTIKGKVPLENPRDLADAGEIISGVMDDLKLGSIGDLSINASPAKGSATVTFSLANGPAPKKPKGVKPRAVKPKKAKAKKVAVANPS